MPFGYVSEYTTVELQNLRNMPQGEPSNGDSISWDDATGKWLYQTIGAGGDVAGPNSSYDQAIVRFDGTTGKIIRNSGVYISDNNDLTNVNQFQLRGTSAGRMTMQAADYTLIDYTVTMPNAQGAASTFLRNDGTGALSWVTAGNVVGPASATNHVVATFDGTTGKLLKGVPVAMDSAGAITGVTTMTVSNTVTGIVAPVNASDAANKNYVDTAIAGLKWKGPVTAASIVNLAAISGLLTVDGVVLVAGNRVLLTAQTNGVQNGIYVVASGAWARSSDLAAGSSANGVSVFVTSGTTQTGTAYTCINTTAAFAYYGAPVGDIVGTDALVFHVFAFNPSGGNVTGPASATSNAVTRFDSTTGKLVKNSAVTISDTADIAGVKTLVLSGSSSGATTLRAAASGATFNLTLPSSVGVVNTFLKDSDGSGTLAFGSAVTNAGVSTDNALARFDATTGQIIQNSALTVSDTADLAGVKTLAMTGSASGTLTVRPAATTTAYTVTLPGAVGASGTFLKASDGAGTLAWGTSGDVSGPSSSTSNAVSRFDLTTGKILKNSAITISDTADLAGVKTLVMSGATSGAVTAKAAGTSANYTLTLPASLGTSGNFLKLTDGAGALGFANAVTNTGGSSDNALARFDATTGQIIQDSLVTLSDTGDLSNVKALAMTGTVNGGVLTMQPAASTTAYTLTMPGTVGAQGTYLKASDASGTLEWAPAGGVNGPSSATANAITRFDSTTGKLVKNSALTISDVAGLAGVKTLAMSGSASGTLTVQPAATTVDYTLTMPGTAGVSGDVLALSDGAGTLSWAPRGDMTGPASAALNAIACFENTTGKVVKSSAVTVSDSADLAGVKTLSMAASSSGVLTMTPAATTTSHALVFPGAPGAAGTFLKASDSLGVLSWGTVGDLYGPPSATANAVARFDSNTGKLVKNSDIFISDVAGLGGIKQLSMNGSAFGAITLQAADATTSHTLTMPGTVGPQGTYLKAADGAGVLEWGMAGDVLGPISSVNNQLARFDGTTGKYVKTCPIVVSDAADVSMVKTLAMHGSSSGASTLRAAAVTTDHTLTLPADKGVQGAVLTAADNSGTLAWTVGGNVVGPSDSSNLAVAVFDGTTGKVIRNSAVTVTANADVEGVKTLTLAGSTSGTVTLRPAAVTTTQSLTLPANKGATGTVLQISDSNAGLLAWTPFPVATGDVIGPASAAANTVALYSGATGKLIKDSVVAINSTGDVTGVATLTVTGKVTGLASPTDASDAVNKSYMDSALAGLKWKAPVRVAATSNAAAISGLLTIDGVTLLAGDRVLLVAQTTGSQNGIYVAAAGAWSRSADMSAGSSVSGAAVFVTAGTTGTGNAYSCSNTAGSDVVGTNALVFVVFAYNPGGGNVVGPASSTDNAVARFDATTGKLLQNSAVTVSDAAAVAGVKSLALSGASSGSVTLLPAAATTTHSLTIPADKGATGTFLRIANNSTGELAWASAVTSAGVSTDNAVARFDAATGLVVQNSGVFISDTNAVSGLASLSMSGATSGAVALVPAASTTTHILTLPADKGATGTYLQIADNSAGTLAWATPGNVTGAASSTDNAVARFDTTTGKLLQNSGVTISDTADIAGAKSLVISGSTSGTFTLAAANTTTSYTVKMPSVQGSNGYYLRNDGAGNLSWSRRTLSRFSSTDYAGELVSGPATATQRAVPRFTDTDGTSLDNTAVFISDSNGLSGATSLAMSGATAGTITIEPAATTSTHTLKLPANKGATGTYLQVSNNATGELSWSVPSRAQPVFYWSRPANGDPRSGQAYNGTFAGDATITGIATYDGVRLTSANANLTGSVNWNVTGFDFSRDFALRVYFYQNNSADGIFIGFGGSSAILNSSTANNAVVFQYNTYSASLNTQFYKNGVAQGTALTFRSGVTYSNSWITTTIEQRTYGSTKVLTVYHGGNNGMENAIQSTTFTFGGSYVAVGARTGGSNGTHHVNGVTLEYL